MIGKYVRLFEFLRNVERSLVRGALVIFTLLTTLTFTRRNDRLAVQELSLCNSAFLSIFDSDLFPFETDRDFRGCVTAYDQLNYAKSKIVDFQESIVLELKSIKVFPVFSREDIEFRYFMPLMSLSRIPLDFFLADLYLNPKNLKSLHQIETALIDCFIMKEAKIVQFISLEKDFYGFDKESWRNGFDKVVTECFIASVFSRSDCASSDRKSAMARFGFLKFMTSLIRQSTVISVTSNFDWMSPVDDRILSKEEVRELDGCEYCLYMLPEFFSDTLLYDVLPRVLKYQIQK
jgi:hypothetical protein